MMEQFISFLIALAVGVIIALLGYFLNINTMKKEGEERANAQLSESIRSILAEVEANLNIANIAQRTLGEKRIMLSFLSEAWEYHRGKIYALPENVQIALHQFYISVIKANGIVPINLHLSYGAGYVDKPYCEEVIDITNKAEKLINLLKDCLK